MADESGQTVDEPESPSGAGDSTSVFQNWREQNLRLLRQGEDELKLRVEYFLTDLCDDNPSVHKEGTPETRIKDADRIATKCARRSVTEPAELLRKSYDRGDGDMTFPVGDLIGIRVLVRSLSDLKAIRRWAEAHPLGDRDSQVIDDINDDPRESGYRALHVDGALPVETLEGEVLVPFEAQFKTLAQHVFGQHTHEDAYVRDAVNEDARFNVVRNLQRAMAEALNAADLMQAEIEVLAERIRTEISEEPAGQGVTAAGVLNIVRDLYGGEVLSMRDAQVVARTARERGIESSDALRTTIAPDGPHGEAARQFFDDVMYREPTPAEQIMEILNRLRTDPNR